MSVSDAKVHRGMSRYSRNEARVVAETRVDPRMKWWDGKKSFFWSDEVAAKMLNERKKVNAGSFRDEEVEQKKATPLIDVG